MKLKKKLVKVIAIACCCKMFILSITPAQAFVWPVISAAAVASFINTVSTGLSQIVVSKAQIDNYTKTIHSIGDQVSTVAKYVADLKRSIESIRQAVNKITRALTYTAKNMEDIMETTDEMMQDAEGEKGDMADKAVGTVEGQTNASTIEEEEEEIVEDTDEENENNNKIDTSIIDEFIAENAAQDKKVKENFEDTSKKIIELSQSGIETLDNLYNSLENNSDVDENEKTKFMSQINAAKKQMVDLQKDTMDLIEAMRDDYDKDSQQISKAYDEYREAIVDYNADKISRKDLSVKGQQLKDTAKNAQSSSKYANQLSSISQKIAEFIETVQEFEETILDGYANNKDYPNEAMLNIKEPSQKYAFNFHQKNNNIQLKACYAQKGNKGCKLFTLKGGDKSFLLSKELTADKSSKITVHDSNGQCQKLTFDDLENEHQDWFMAKLRDCVTRANTEKTYFWPEIGDEEELAKMNVFDGKTEPNFHKNKDDSYEKKGVYRHIAEDYAAANIINSNQGKQYARSWLGGSGGKDAKDSELSKFLRDFKDPNTTRDAYNFLAGIEIESLKMYSWIRRVEAINKAKEAVDVYRPLKHLYIDGRDEDYKNANHTPGKNSIPIGAVKEKPCADCDEKVITVISNVFPYLCDGSGADFSLPYESKNDAGKMKKVELAIRDCMKKYIEPATNGSNDSLGRFGMGPDDIKRGWRELEVKAMTDSLYHTIALSTINLYLSAKDYAYLKKAKEVNIASINQDLKDGKSSRNDYGAGAKINHYGAQQLLTIIDADAQALQSEIIKDMLDTSFDFFDDPNPNAAAIE